MEDMKDKKNCRRRRRSFDRSRSIAPHWGCHADALTKKGYHIEMMELVPKEFAKTLTEKGIDIVFNALHGRYGEDGVIQGLCEMMGIPIPARASWPVPSV